MGKKNVGKSATYGLFAAAIALGALPGCTKKGGDTFKGTAKGKMGDVTVEVVYKDNKIESVTVTEQTETAGIADPALEQVPAAIVENNTPNVDTVSGATVTSQAIIDATKAALKEAGVDPESMGSAAGAHENVPVTYTEGTYTGTGTGYNGPITLDVTFSKDGITDIQINSSKETNHIGSPAYEYLFEDAKQANGSGIDVVSGATFTSKGVKDALADAAEQANASDLDGFKSNTYVHEAQAPIEETFDVVVVGAGGAGMAAAVEAAQNGLSVCMIEENAEIGGNTIASGGQFQAVQKYLCWEESNPDATTGEYEGKTYDKVKMANGNIDVMKTILNWNEDEFNGDYFKDKEFVAGDIKELSQAGVHAEYLPTLQALKKEIQAYLDWAQPKLDAGENEGDLPLFSTENLHVFQTYYGGLRQNAEKTDWIYGDAELVKQFIAGGQELKGWLEDQGALFDNSIQPTIVGALWQRENDFLGCDLDGDGEADPDNGGSAKTVFNTYVATTRNTLLNTVENHDQNKIMVRTKADSLIQEDGAVTGVKATMYDGTEVTLHANQGVVLATGGYAANIERVKETNDYWAEGAISDSTKTTNRSSLVGDGIDMGEAVGASTTGMGFAQMMPISWVDNGNLAFGGGDYAIHINPTTGKRYVNETSERDVLSMGEFANGITFEGTNGTVIEIANDTHNIPGPYPYGTPKDEDLTLWDSDVTNRQYTRTIDQFADLFKEIGIDVDADAIIETIKEYDAALMADKGTELDPEKTGWSALIGEAEKDDKGNYKADTYKLDGVKLKVRLLAPSTHHTMGGLTVDTDRHVLDKDGNTIKGLYAAGEVTGGIHGGNRLGGNAIVEIFVSGRTAADAIVADNK